MQGVYSRKALIISNIISFLIFPFFKVLNIFRKNYDLKETTINKILILEYHRIGDAIMILGVLRSLRENYPNSKITLVCNSEAFQLMKNFNIVDNLIPISTPWTDWDFTLTKVSKVLSLIKRLKKQNFDLAFSFKGDIRDNWLLWKVASKISIGYYVTGGRFFLSHPQVFDRSLHQKDRAKYMLKKIGCNTFQAKNKVLNNEKGCIVFHNGARDFRRRWPKEKWVKLIKLVKKDHKVGIVKVKEGEAILKMLKKSKKDLKVFEGNLVDFKIWLENQKMLICVDSMAGHLSAEIGVPSITIFGSQNPKLTAPVGAVSEVVKPKQACIHKRDHWRLCKDCISSIREEDVYKKIFEVLALINDGKK